MIMMALWMAAAGAAAPAPAVSAYPGKPLACETPDEVMAGRALVLHCAAPSRDDRPLVVLVHFRRAGQEEFTTAPTLRTREGRYTATICTELLGAGAVHYYVEARDSRDQVVATSGEPASPHVLMVLGGRRQTQTTGATSGSAGDIDPLAHLRAEREAARTSAEAVGRRRPRRLFLGMGIGRGYGWHPSGPLDFRRDLKASAGTAPAGRLVLTPEIGYQLSDAISLALQARVQVIGASGSGDASVGAPKRGAWAVMGRGSYHLGTGRAQLVASAALGAGQGFRLVVDPQPQAGLLRNDSVTGGPVVLGPGLGAIYHLGHHTALQAELRMLAGLPRFATMFDLVTGIAVAF
jgi:hypothetical protein